MSVMQQYKSMVNAHAINALNFHANLWNMDAFKAMFFSYSQHKENLLTGKRRYEIQPWETTGILHFCSPPHVVSEAVRTLTLCPDHASWWTIKHRITSVGWFQGRVISSGNWDKSYIVIKDISLVFFFPAIWPAMSGCSISQSPAFSRGRSELTDRNVELYPQFFLELITTQLRFYMVSPQLSLLNAWQCRFNTSLEHYCFNTYGNVDKLLKSIGLHQVADFKAGVISSGNWEKSYLVIYRYFARVFFPCHLTGNVWQCRFLFSLEHYSFNTYGNVDKLLKSIGLHQVADFKAGVISSGNWEKSYLVI